MPTKQPVLMENHLSSLSYKGRQSDTGDVGYRRVLFKTQEETSLLILLAAVTTALEVRPNELISTIICRCTNSH